MGAGDDRSAAVVNLHARMCSDHMDSTHGKLISFPLLQEINTKYKPRLYLDPAKISF